jgi:hypothetical protein
VPSVPATTTQAQVPGGRAYTVRTYNDNRRAELAQYWVVRGMNHAWSGGDPSQPYADPAGPDESAAMYAFFLSHPAASLLGTTTTPPPATTPAPAPTPRLTTVSKPSPGPGVPTVSKPKLSHGRLVFTISGPGSVTLLLQRRLTGHLKQGRCVAGKKRRRGCTKYSTRVKIVRRAGSAGQIAITQPKTVHGHRLPPGRYRAVVTPADAEGHAGTAQSLALVLR